MTSQHKKLKYFTTKGDTVSRDQNLLASMAGWDIIEFWAGYLNILFEE